MTPNINMTMNTKMNFLMFAAVACVAGFAVAVAGCESAPGDESEQGAVLGSTAGAAAGAALADDNPEIGAAVGAAAGGVGGAYGGDQLEDE